MDIAIFANTGMGYTPVLQCNNHWDLSVNVAGVGTVSAEGIFPHANPPSTGACNTLEPCNAHSLWPINLEEAETGGFIVHVNFCLENTGTGLSGATFDIECGYDATKNTIHCDEVLIPGAIEVEGEMQVHGDLGVMHEIE